MVMIKCPCCHGIGLVEEEAPVPLTPIQQKIYDIVRSAKHGIDGPTLVNRVYADREDGGPEFASVCVHMTIMRMNKRLLPANIKIGATHRGVGGKFRVERLDV